MTVKEIYEKVCLIKPIEQRLFFSRLNDSILELISMYKEKKVLLADTSLVEIKGLNDSLIVRDLYVPGIVDNIVFLSGGGDGLKSEFIRKSREAYKTYASGDTGLKIIKRSGW